MASNDSKIDEIFIFLDSHESLKLKESENWITPPGYVKKKNKKINKMRSGFISIFLHNICVYCNCHPVVMAKRLHTDTKSFNFFLSIQGNDDTFPLFCTLHYTHSSLLKIKNMTEDN